MKTPKELALLAARALSDKKGKEIQALEIAGLTTLADYFVLARFCLLRKPAPYDDLSFYIYN